MIQPSVGRRVWYWPFPEERSFPSEQPFDAGVAYVHSDTLINISIQNDLGNPLPGKLGVTLAQDDQEPQPGQCSWMPYQKGQAAKQERTGPQSDVGFGTN